MTQQWPRPGRLVPRLTRSWDAGLTAPLTRLLAVFLLAITVCTARTAAQEIAMADTSGKLSILSLDSLLNIKVSTASKYEQTASEAPASVTIITADDIRLFGYRTLDDVLRNVRGFYTSYDRNYAYAGIRGFGRPTDYNDRVLLLLDGHTTNESVYGSAFIGTDLGIDLRSLDRIEIVRGPGSALYGAGAMFSVINLISKSGKAMDGVEVAGEVGSFHTVTGSAMVGREVSADLDFSASALWGDTRGHDLHYHEYMDVHGGVAANLDWERYAGFKGMLRFKKFSLLSNGTSREKGIPTGAFDVAFNDRRTYSIDRRGMVELKYDDEVGLGKNVMARGYLDGYQYYGYYPYDVLTMDGSIGGAVGSELQFRWDVRSNNRLTLGGEFRRNLRADYSFWDADTVYFDKNFPFTVLSAYVQDEYQPVENLSLTVGLRHDNYSSGGNSTTPRAAIVYHPIRTGTLKLLYGEAFRLPNIYEAYYEDPNAGYKVNPGLTSEKIRTAEAVWEQRLNGTMLGSLSVYQYDMDDLIDPTIDPADGMVVYRNVSRVRARGVETEFNAHFEHGLRGFFSYTYQDARDLDRWAILTNSPRHLFKAGAAYRFAENLSAAFTLRHESRRTTVQGTETRPHVVGDLNLSLRPWTEYLHCSLLIRNLFNTAYETPAGYEHRQAAIAQDGRTFLFRIGLGM